MATARARNLYWGLRDEPGARAAVTVALAAVEGTATDTGAGASPLTVALRGFLALLSHRPADALAEVTPVLDGPDGDPATTAALAVAAVAQVQLGCTEDAVPLAVRGLAAGPDPTGGWLTVELRSAQWSALLATGRLDDAEELARACHAEAAPGGVGEHVALYVTWLGIVASRRGRLQTAVRLLHEAASGVSSRRFPYTVPLVGELAVALAGLGRTTEGQDVLVEAHGVPGGPLTGWVWAAQVWIAGVEGRVTRATELAGEERPAASPSDHLRALHTAVRLGVGRPVLEADRAGGRDHPGPASPSRASRTRGRWRPATARVSTRPRAASPSWTISCSPPRPTPRRARRTARPGTPARRAGRRRAAAWRRRRARGPRRPPRGCSSAPGSSPRGRPRSRRWPRAVSRARRSPTSW